METIKAMLLYLGIKIENGHNGRGQIWFKNFPYHEF